MYHHIKMKMSDNIFSLIKSEKKCDVSYFLFLHLKIENINFNIFIKKKKNVKMEIGELLSYKNE